MEEDAETQLQSIFVTEVIMEKDKLFFVPSVEDFEDQIDAIIDDYVATVSSKVRLLGHEELIECVFSSHCLVIPSTPIFLSSLPYHSTALSSFLLPFIPSYLPNFDSLLPPSFRSPLF